ncbi:LysM peptidoglycan-binding domain-containing protein [Litchfieldella rifensis]|uniref:LysM peptidoglycan-binding domain-containing protein n=1 Tax=Litchfieldella rifensis TaxID=762643 RepID=A0ABV7LI99_9GAMM
MALELAQRIVTARQSQAPGNGTSSGVTIHKIQSGNTTLDVGGDYGYTLPNLELMVPVLHDNSDVEVEDDTLKIRDEALFQAVKTAVEPWDDYLESDEGVRQLQAGAEGDGAVEDIAGSIAENVGEDIAEDVIEDVTQGQSLDEVAESRGISRDQLIARLEAAGFDVTTIEPTNKNGDVEGVEIRQTTADEGAETGKLIVGSYDDHHNDARTTRYTDADGNKIRRVEYADGEISESVTDTEGTETTTVTKPDGTVVETVIEANGRQTKTTTEPPENGKLITHDVKPGESLSEIAGQYEGVEGWQDLEPDNRDFFNDRNPNLIHPGEEITIGGGRTTVEVTHKGYTLTTEPDGEMSLRRHEDGVKFDIEQGSPEASLVELLMEVNLDSHDPQKAKEAEIIQTVVEKALAGKAIEAFKGQGEGPQQAINEGKPGRNVTLEDPYGDPPSEAPPSGGDWVPMHGVWLDPEVASTIAAQNVTLTSLIEAQAQLDVYALDPDYKEAMTNAGVTLDEAFAPHGLSWIRPDPKGKQKGAEERLEQVGQAKEEYQETQKLLKQAIAKQEEMAPLLTPSFEVCKEDDTEADIQRRADKGDKREAAQAQVDALFYGAGLHSSKGDDLLATHTVDQLRHQLENTDPDTKAYRTIEGALKDAEAVQKKTGKQLETAQAYYDFYAAKSEAGELRLQAYDKRDELLAVFNAEKGLLEEGKQFSTVGGDYLGEFTGQQVIEEREDGLWVITHFEEGTTDEPLAPDEMSSFWEENRDPELTRQWLKLVDNRQEAHENVAHAGRDLHQVLEDQLGVTLENLGTETGDLKQELDELLKKHGPGSTERPDDALPDGTEPVKITIGDHEVQVIPQVAEGYEENGLGALTESGQPIGIEIDGEWRWVHPEMAITRIALDAAKDQEKDQGQVLSQAQEVARRTAERYDLLATQSMQRMGESETEYNACLDYGYLDEQEEQALDSIYQPLFQELYKKEGFDNEFERLGASDIKERVGKVLGLNGASEKNRESLEEVTEAIHDIGGSNPEINDVPFFYVDDTVGKTQAALIAVRNSDGDIRYVDATGKDFSSLEDFVDNNDQFSEEGKLVVPKGLEMKPGEDNTIPLEVVNARNVSIFEKSVDPLVGIGTGIATALSFTPAAPVAAPLAYLGGGYLGFRAAQHQINHLQHGGDWYDWESSMNYLSVATTLLPVGSSVLRTIGMPGMMRGVHGIHVTRGEAFLTSIGAVKPSSMLAGHATTYLRSTDGLNRIARSLDWGAIGTGVPLMAMSAYNLVVNGDQMSDIQKTEAIVGGLTGLVGTGLGIHGLWRTRPNRGTQAISGNGPDPQAGGSGPNVPPGGPELGPTPNLVVYEAGPDGVYRPTDERVSHDPSKTIIRHEDISDSDVSQAARTTQDIAALPARDHQELEGYHPSHPTRSQSSSPEMSESAAVSHNGSSPRHSYRTIQVDGAPVEVKFLSGQPPKSDESVYVLPDDGPRASTEELVATGKTHIIGLNPNTREWEGAPLVLGASEDHASSQPSNTENRVKIPPVAYYKEPSTSWIGARVPGHPDAHVNMIIENPGIPGEKNLGDRDVVEITHIYRGTLPRHGASELAAQVLETYGVRPTEKLIFRSVENESALLAYATEQPASETNLARTGERILDLLGLKASSWEFITSGRGGLDIVGHIDPLSRKSLDLEAQQNTRLETLDTVLNDYLSPNASQNHARITAEVIDAEHIYAFDKQMTPHDLLLSTDLHKNRQWRDHQGPIVLDIQNPSAVATAFAQRLSNIYGSEVVAPSANAPSQWKVLRPDHNTGERQQGSVELMDGELILTQGGERRVIQPDGEHLGEMVGAGLHKTAIRLYDKVLVIYRDGRGLYSAAVERGAAEEYIKLGAPYVAPIHGAIKAKGHDALLMDYYPAHSSTIETLKPSLLNENSVRSLKAIRQFIEKKNKIPSDLQFLIDPDGFFYLHDFQEIRSPMNSFEIHPLNRFIDLAEATVRARQNPGPQSLSAAYHPASDPNVRPYGPAATAFTRPSLPEPTPSFQLPHIIADVAPRQPARVTLPAEYAPLPSVEYFIDGNEISLDHSDSTVPLVHVNAIVNDPSGIIGHGPVTSPEVVVEHFFAFFGKSGTPSPSGSGSRLLAGLLKHFEVRPTERLIFRDVINEQTREAYEQGADPANTVLGRSGARALQRLGLEAAGFRFKSGPDDSLELVIDIAPQAHQATHQETAQAHKGSPAEGVFTRIKNRLGNVPWREDRGAVSLDFLFPWRKSNEPENTTQTGEASPPAVHMSAPPAGQPRLYRLDDLGALRQAVNSGEIPVGNYLHVIRTQRAANTFALNDGKVPYSGRIQDNGRILWPAGRTGHVDDISVTTPNAEGRQVVQVRSEGADGQRTHYARSNDDVYIVVTELSAQQLRGQFHNGEALPVAEYQGENAWLSPAASALVHQTPTSTSEQQSTTSPVAHSQAEPSPWQRPEYVELPESFGFADGDESVSRFQDGLFDAAVRDPDRLSAAIESAKQYSGTGVFLISPQAKQRIVGNLREAWQHILFSSGDTVPEGYSPSDYAFLQALVEHVQSHRIIMEEPSLGPDGSPTKNGGTTRYRLYHTQEALDAGNFSQRTEVTHFLERLLSGSHFVSQRASGSNGDFYRSLESSPAGDFTRRATGHSHYRRGVVLRDGLVYPNTVTGDKAPETASLLSALLIGHTQRRSPSADTFLQLEGWPARGLTGIRGRHGQDFSVHRQTGWNISTYGASPFSEKHALAISLVPDTVLPARPSTPEPIPSPASLRERFSLSKERRDEAKERRKEVKGHQTESNVDKGIEKRWTRSNSFNELQHELGLEGSFYADHLVHGLSEKSPRILAGIVADARGVTTTGVPKDGRDLKFHAGNLDPHARSIVGYPAESFGSGGENALTAEQGRYRLSEHKNRRLGEEHLALLNEDPELAAKVDPQLRVPPGLMGMRKRSAIQTIEKLTAEFPFVFSGGVHVVAERGVATTMLGRRRTPVNQTVGFRFDNQAQVDNLSKIIETSQERGLFVTIESGWGPVAVGQDGRPQAGTLRYDRQFQGIMRMVKQYDDPEAPIMLSDLGLDVFTRPNMGTVKLPVQNVDGNVQRMTLPAHIAKMEQLVATAPNTKFSVGEHATRALVESPELRQALIGFMQRHPDAVLHESGSVAVENDSMYRRTLTKQSQFIDELAQVDKHLAWRFVRGNYEALVDGSRARMAERTRPLVLQEIQQHRAQGDWIEANRLENRLQVMEGKLKTLEDSRMVAHGEALTAFDDWLNMPRIETTAPSFRPMTEVSFPKTPPPAQFDRKQQVGVGTPWGIQKKKAATYVYTAAAFAAGHGVAYVAGNAAEGTSWATGLGTAGASATILRGSLSLKENAEKRHNRLAWERMTEKGQVDEQNFTVTMNRFVGVAREAGVAEQDIQQVVWHAGQMQANIAHLQQSQLPDAAKIDAILAEVRRFENAGTAALGIEPGSLSPLDSRTRRGRRIAFTNALSNVVSLSTYHSIPGWFSPAHVPSLVGRERGIAQNALRVISGKRGSNVADRNTELRTPFRFIGATLPAGLGVYLSVNDAMALTSSAMNGDMSGAVTASRQLLLDAAMAGAGVHWLAGESRAMLRYSRPGSGDKETRTRRLAWTFVAIGAAALINGLVEPLFADDEKKPDTTNKPTAPDSEAPQPIETNDSERTTPPSESAAPQPSEPDSSNRDEPTPPKNEEPQPDVPDDAVEDDETDESGRFNPDLKDSADYEEIIVQQGQTMGGIAVRHGHDIAEVVELNMGHIPNPSVLYPGDRVYFPR